MSTISQVILSSVSGAVVGSIFYSLSMALIIFILNKVDKSGGWIGVIQNPVLLASISGAIVGGVLGFLTGLVIGWIKTTVLIKGALVGFAVTELVVIAFFVVLSFVNFSHYNSFSRVSESIVDSFFSFLILSFFLVIPSIIIGVGTVKMNDLMRSVLNFQS